MVYFDDIGQSETSVSIPMTIVPGIALILINSAVLIFLSVMRREVPRAYGWVSWSMYLIYLVLAVLLAVLVSW